jgi:hypothetical protein
MSTENKLPPHIVEVIANRFSIIYGGPIQSPCACMGITCGDLRCSNWWEMILNQNEEIKKKAIDIYTRNWKNIESGVLKIIGKKYLV